MKKIATLHSVYCYIFSYFESWAEQSWKKQHVLATEHAIHQGTHFSLSWAGFTKRAETYTESSEILFLSNTFINQIKTKILF